MIRPFSRYLWVGFFISTLIFVSSIILTDKSSSRVRKYFYEREERFDYNMIFIIIIGDGSSNIPSKNSTRLIVMSFILLCLVLRCVYASAMFNFFSTADSHPPIAKFKELDERRYTFHVPDYFRRYLPFDQLRIDEK